MVGCGWCWMTMTDWSGRISVWAGIQSGCIPLIRNYYYCNLNHGSVVHNKVLRFSPVRPSPNCHSTLRNDSFGDIYLSGWPTNATISFCTYIYTSTYSPYLLFCQAHSPQSGFRVVQGRWITEHLSQSLILFNYNAGFILKTPRRMFFLWSIAINGKVSSTSTVTCRRIIKIYDQA